MSRCSNDHQNRDLSHAWMAGTNISINSRGRTTLNSIFTLTGVQDKQYCLYKNNIFVGIYYETSIESWIGQSTNYREISQRGKSRTECKSDILTCDGIDKSDQDDETVPTWSGDYLVISFSSTGKEWSSPGGLSMIWLIFLPVAVLLLCCESTPLAKCISTPNGTTVVK